MSTISRQAIKAELLGLANTQNGIDDLYELLVDYPIGAFTEGPVLRIYSMGSVRNQAGLNSNQYHTEARLVIENWVPDAETGWTEAEVEDKLDELEVWIADLIAANRQGTNYDYLAHEEDVPSQIIPVELKGGQSYIIERIFVVATKYRP